VNARKAWRERWDIPAHARVIGMLGAVKPQKDYPRALRLFAALLAQRDARLVILGGPVGRDGAGAWYALLATAQRLGIEHLLRVPGFITHAAACLPAFDLLLNTSHYEGLSIATLEALAAGLPCVVNAVGGQGELSASGLTLMDAQATAGHTPTGARMAGLSRPPAMDAVSSAAAESNNAWRVVRHRQPQCGRRAAFLTESCLRHEQRNAS
jgi:glycosyltransferase involved in cell wall biosynthesis